MRNLGENPALFADEDDAMVRLGVGKNMVRAIRFWADAVEVIQNPKNKSQDADAEAARLGRKVSGVTLDQHFTTFLHTYVPTRSKKGEVLEDNLDCPLVELELIQKVGERPTGDSNRHEAIYAFRVEDKPDISPELFIYCLEDFWAKRHPNERTLTFREIAVGEGGPGQILKLPEHDIRERLESIERDSDGRLLYQESAAFQQVARAGQSGPTDLLDRIYRKPADTARSPSTPPYQSGLQERAVAYAAKRGRRRLRTR